MERQGFFKRAGEYIAVRPIKLSSRVTLEPGASVDMLRVFQLRYLFKNRRIGHKDSIWAKHMLLLLEAGKANLKPEITDVDDLKVDKKSVKKPVKKAPPKPPSKNKDNG